MQDGVFSTSELVAMAHQYLPRNYAPPDDTVLFEGNGTYVMDVEGRVFLDMLSCYSALVLGHSHPEIVRAIKEQAEKMQANANCFWEEQKILCAKELAELTGMDKVLFMNTGAEAFESALKLVRKWGYRGYLSRRARKNHAEIIVCEGNFHGRTMGAISASTVRQYYELFGPRLSGFIKVVFGDPQAVEDAITEDTVAIILEPILGEGGIIVPPDGYLAAVREICDKYKIMMVADEVQTGLGRTGKMFACDHENVKPDAYLLGKALGGGLAISAVAGKSDLMDVFEPGDHGSTFGGNPQACAVARVAMRIIQRENLPQRAEELGKYFLQALREIQLQSRHIKEVRGKGLLIGVELYPEAGGAKKFCDALRKQMILCKDVHEHVLRFAPPLIIRKLEIDWVLQRIRTVFTQ